MPQGLQIGLLVREAHAIAASCTAVAQPMCAVVQQPESVPCDARAMR